MKMRKGEIWQIELIDAQGHEQQGQRPAIVIGSANGMAIAIPLTTNTARAALSHTLVVDPTKENGLSDESVAMVFQLRSLDKSRFKRKLGEITKEQIKAMDEILLDLSGIKILS